MAPDQPTIYAFVDTTLNVIWITRDGHVLQRQAITYPSHWPRTKEEQDAFRESLDQECANDLRSAKAMLGGVHDGLFPGQARSY